jgi:hypothetical protein
MLGEVVSEATAGKEAGLDGPVSLKWRLSQPHIKDDSMVSLHKLALAASLAALAFGASAQTAAGTQAADSTQAAPAQAADGSAVKAAFKRADANSDGKMSREEAAALPAVAEKFTQLDKDSDGSISAAEFEAGVASAAPAAK